MSQTQTLNLQNTAVSNSVGTIGLRGSTVPLARNHSLDKWSNFASTPVIGQEFGSDIQLSQIVKKDPKERDELLRDLAVLVSQRGVVFFRGQDIQPDDQETLGLLLGRLSGNPSSSHLHIHPTTEANAPKGDTINIISSERKAEFSRGDRSRLAARLWHADLTWEPVPSDYAILKIHTAPSTGGDTVWASAYEAYSRLSPSMAAYLETLRAYHEASFFNDAATAFGIDMRTGQRGSPANHGSNLSAIHPIIRVNPVTGWKGLYVNSEFTKRIIGVTKDESDLLLTYLFKLVSENHDLQVRFSWSRGQSPGVGDVAMWDNRSTMHSATNDYNETRIGDRVVSVGEKPYFDPAGKERRAALGLKSWHDAPYALGYETIAAVEAGIRYTVNIGGL